MTEVNPHSEHKRLLSLHQLITKEIKKHQGIDFAHFMNLVLYSEFGYYQAKSSVFGKSGDYITAPELTDLFGKCLANQCAEILTILQNGNILEFGAGTGSLAKTLISHLDKLNCLPNHYYIIEPSSGLRELQKKNLASLPNQLGDKLVWVNEIPENFVGVLLANEVLDAMPVHRFRIDDHHFFEYFITIDTANAFQWELKNITHGSLFEKCLQIKNRYLPTTTHYSSEYNLGMQLFLQQMAKKIDKAVFLIVDYGYHAAEYYHPERNQGTLTCFFQHNHHNNPLLHIGNQDISTHVNFSQLAEEAQPLNFEILGYTNQAAFLLNCGLLEQISAYDDIQIKQHIQTLTLPTEMGELIKVIALAKNFSADLLGFKSYNKQHYLEIL